jgi:hypothetical protein
MPLTLADARLECAREAGMAFSGVCTASGGVDHLIDAVLADVGVSADFLQHAWIYRPAAAAADRQRNIDADGFTVATARLTPSRNWLTPPDNAEAYQVFNMIPPTAQAGVPLSWNRAINNALRMIYFEDEMVIGRGTYRSDRRFSLARSEVVIIDVVAVAGGTNATITPPSGATLILRTDSGTDLALATYWRRANANDAEIATYTFDTSRAAAGGSMAYADANVNAPVNASAGEATLSSVTATAPTITPTVTRGRVLHAWGAVGSIVIEPPTTDDERFDAESHSAAGQMAVALSDADYHSGVVASAEATLGAAGINIGQTLLLQSLTSSRDVAPVSRGTDGNNGAGATTLDLPRPSSLPNDDWVPTREAVRGVYLRGAATGVYYDVDTNRGGTRPWSYVTTNGEGGIELAAGPGQDTLVLVRVTRPYPTLTLDADVTYCDPVRLVPMAIWQAYDLLNSAGASIGQYKAETAAWQEKAQSADRPRRPASVLLY